MARIAVLIFFTIISVILGVNSKVFGVEKRSVDDAIIEIMPDDIISTVSPYLFGSNIRWLWNADGAWDWKKKAANKNVLGALLELKPTVMRYPGGSEANRYDWRAGVGPVQLRPMLVGVDGNDVSFFGTDEFLALCKQIGAEPIITANAATLTERDAAEWVKYTNSRKKNDLMKVKFWEIGNEPEGEGIASRQYAEKVNLFANAMKAADPDIQIGAAVSDRSDPDAAKWDSPLLQAAGKNIDFITPHFYSIFNSGWVFYGDRAKSVEFNADSGGQYILEFIANGTPADGGWPIIAIKVNKAVVGKLTVESPVWRTYKMPINLSAGKNRITISFINDHVSKNGEDRNCFIYDMLVKKGNDVIYELFSGDNISNALFGTINDHEARLRNLKHRLQVAPKKDIKIAITEYNVIYNNKGHLPAGYSSRFDEISNLRSALFVGDLLSLFIREDVWMANFWALMGGMGNLQVSEEKIFYRPSYYVIKMFREHAGQRLCSNLVQVAKMNSVPLAIYPAHNDIPVLGVTSTVDRNGRIIVSVINRSGDTDINSTIRIKDSVGGYLRKATVLTGDSMEADGKHRGAISYYSTDAVTGTNEFKYLFPKHSVVQMELVPLSAK